MPVSTATVTTAPTAVTSAAAATDATTADKLSFVQKCFATGKIEGVKQAFEQQKDQMQKSLGKLYDPVQKFVDEQLDVRRKYKQFLLFKFGFTSLAHYGTSLILWQLIDAQADDNDAKNRKHNRIFCLGTFFATLSASALLYKFSESQFLKLLTVSTCAASSIPAAYSLATDGKARENAQLKTTLSHVSNFFSVLIPLGLLLFADEE